MSTATSAISERYTNRVFAPVDHDHQVERVGGGFETEVYCTDDRRYVVKLKTRGEPDLATMLRRTRVMRSVATEFARCLGTEHSIANEYVLSEDDSDRIHALAVQPFIRHARPLNRVDYRALSPETRDQVAAQLHEILRRSLAFYRETGYMPDLYGLSSSSREDRTRLSAPWMLPWHLWSFFVQRNILRSCNLLLTEAPEHRVVLIDYDLVPWPRPLKRIYFAVRWVMGWRDHLLVARMRWRSATTATARQG